ncbi:MAG: HupE/UreJ family protein [Pseudomonadota bacterium]
MLLTPALKRRWLILCLLGWLLSTPCYAHLLNMTRVSVVLHEAEAGELLVEIDLGQSLMGAADYWALAKAEGDERSRRLAPVLEALERGLTLRIDGANVGRTFVDAQFEAASLAAIENPLTPQMAQLRWRLPPTAGSVLSVELAPDFEVPWPCLVRSDSDRRTLPVSRLLTADRLSSGALALTEQHPSEAGQDSIIDLLMVYGFLGFQHILPLGLDHVLFVLGLFFLGGGVRQLVALVSCFTVAHSLTLALATFRIVDLPAELVEPLIAASIVYVGLERLLVTDSGALVRQKLRYGVVFSFGLLHGLGFARVLGEVGLPDGQFLLSLLAFNVGVELGQLFVLLLAFLCFGFFQNRSWYASCIATPGATVVAGVGLYWLIQRISV